jgi:hypothetical protein
LGTICVIDTNLEFYRLEQINSFKALSDQTKLLELRLHKTAIEKRCLNLRRKTQHRAICLPSPRTISTSWQILGLTELSKQLEAFFGSRWGRNIDMIRSSSGKLKEMIDNLLEYSQTNTIKKEKNSSIICCIKIFCSFAFKKIVISLFKATLQLL